MTPATKMPEWLEPMAATLTEERFSGPDWLFERKFDGIRLLAYKRGGDVRLYSRNRLPQHLPAVARAVASLPVDDVILDGEVTWDGRSGYHVFDILWLDGAPSRRCRSRSGARSWSAAVHRTDAPRRAGGRARRRGSAHAARDGKA